MTRLLPLLQLAEYKAHHDNSWPEVESALRSVGMRNLSLWAYGNRMFYYAEYVGDTPFDKAYVVAFGWSYWGWRRGCIVEEVAPWGPRGVSVVWRTRTPTMRPHCECAVVVAQFQPTPQQPTGIVA